MATNLLNSTMGGLLHILSSMASTLFSFDNKKYPKHVYSIAACLMANGFIIAEIPDSPKLKVLSIQTYWEAVGITLGQGWLQFSEDDCWVIDDRKPGNKSSNPQIKLADQIVKAAKQSIKTHLDAGDRWL